MARFFRPLSSRGVTFWPLWQELLFFQFLARVAFLQRRILAGLLRKKDAAAQRKTSWFGSFGRDDFLLLLGIQGEHLVANVGVGGQKNLVLEFQPDPALYLHTC